MKTDYMTKKLFLGVVLTAWCLQAGWAFDIDADQELEGGSVLGGVGAGNNITPTAVSSNGYYYNWNDTNGPAPGEDSVATPGLDLQVHKIWNDNGESLYLNLGGGSITGSGEVAFSTSRGGSVRTTYPKQAGDVIVTNVGDVTIGEIVTSHSGESGYNSYARSGDVQIGENVTGRRAGYIRIDSIDTRQRYGANNDYRSGHVSLYGNSDVLIETSSGTPGDILTYHPCSDGGSVVISHDGEFRARNLYTYTDSSWIVEHAGNVTLEGDVLADGASGACRINSVSMYSFFSTGYSGRGGNLHVSGYTEVTITGNIDSYTSALSSSHLAGDVTVEDVAGDIVIDGSINLNTADPSKRNGIVSLTCAGQIIFNGGIDFSGIERAVFNSGEIKNFIHGPVLGFLPANDCLRASAGKKVIYDPKEPANAYLGGGVFILNQPDGSPGGGKLMPPDQGTIVTFR